MSWKLNPIGEFAAYAPHWAQLNTLCGNSPLLHLDFIEPMLAHLADGDEWLACYERDGKIAAMAILKQRSRNTWETFQPSQQPLGLWLSDPALPLPQLLHELTRALPGMPLVVGITQRDPFLAARPADGGAITTSPYIETAKITLSGTFDDYWLGRGKNLRANLKKQRNKLLKEGIATRLDIVVTPDDMTGAVTDYGRLESAGWKADKGTAVNMDNAQGRFYRDMLARFAARGAGSVYRYWFDDRLVAMNLCIEGDGSLIVLKTTYDESLSSSYSPAFLMREDECKQLFGDSRYQRLEFYGRVMEWHRRWTDEVRTMYHVSSYRWPALLRLHSLVKQGRAALQRPRTQAAAPGPQPTGEPSTE